MEELNDAATKDKAMILLIVMFPVSCVPKPVTRCSRDENFKGSYTAPNDNLSKCINALGKWIGWDIVICWKGNSK